MLRRITPGRAKWRSPGGPGLLAGIAALLFASPAVADPWYVHYANAEQAIEDQDWALAVQETNEALARKGDSGARVRTYGMNVTSYFPYLRLGIAYYQLGQHAGALQAFETEARLGVIEQSATANAELERFRGLAEQALAAVSAAEQQRVRDLVEQSLGEARQFERGNQLAAAIASLDRALAVAPQDTDALAAMAELRRRFAEYERAREIDQTVAGLVADGRALLLDRRYSEAASTFRQALFLKPDPGVQALFDSAQRALAGELEVDHGLADPQATPVAGLEDVLALESAGRLAEALDRLESILALAPSDPDAISLQRRLLQTSREAEAGKARRETIDRLLAEADAQFAAGLPEESLSAANRILALDPGNDAALAHIARGYGMINQKLLGSELRGNIPPAVRFVDLRQPGDDGAPVEVVDVPDFRLNGVIIDDSPVEVVFFGHGGTQLQPTLSSQPLGDFIVTEFSLVSRLSPGRSDFRLVATDSEDLSSSSEYSVLYVRPLFRAPWFYASLLVAVVALGGTPLWRRHSYRRNLRRRKFNPYVAGAPVFNDEMFFGRRELVDRILQTIHNNSLLIYGERRIGKTSIQHQLKRRLRRLDDPHYEFFPVYVDLQGTPETRFFQTIADEIFQELGPMLDGLQPGTDKSGMYTYRDFIRDVRAILKALEVRTSKKVRLVLLIDEVDALNDYDPRVNQKLRSLFMKSFAENLVAVVSGVRIKKHWEREGSPWYNFFEEIEVKPFGPREAQELIERPIGTMFKLDDGVVERIISLSAGKPYLIQKICMSIVTRLHEQCRRRVTVADVEAVCLPETA